VTRPFLSASIVAFTLAACTQTSAPPAPTPVARSPGAGVTAPGFRLPEGSGCAAEASRFRSVMDNDLETGHVAASVHRQVVAEIDAASAACAAGRDEEARTRLRATRVRFGYPA
jgi:hypothetical protein